MGIEDPFTQAWMGQRRVHDTTHRRHSSLVLRYTTYSRESNITFASQRCSQAEPYQRPCCQLDSTTIAVWCLDSWEVNTSGRVSIKHIVHDVARHSHSINQVFSDKSLSINNSTKESNQRIQPRVRNIHVEHGGARKSSPPLRIFLT